MTARRVAGGRRLVLLRHGKSDWPDVADHERPLAKRGRRDAPVAGRWLGESGYAPDAVICSTAQRARQTWELAAGGLQAAVPGTAPVVRYEPRVYEASVLGLLMLVREFSPDWRTALVVGHNPGMAELTLGLTDPPPDPPAAFPTAAIAVLSLPGPWSQAGPCEAKLLAFAVPADMHSLFACSLRPPRPTRPGRPARGRPHWPRSMPGAARNAEAGEPAAGGTPRRAASLVAVTRCRRT